MYPSGSPYVGSACFSNDLAIAMKLVNLLTHLDGSFTKTVKNSKIEQKYSNFTDLHSLRSLHWL